MEISTVLGVEEIASRFKACTAARPSGFVGLVAAKGLDWRFFTPPADHDPFATVSRPPTFTVAAEYSPRVGSSGMGHGAIVLAVWDGGAQRAVQLREVGEPSSASRKYLKYMTRELGG